MDMIAGQEESRRQAGFLLLLLFAISFLSLDKIIQPKN
jgi:hypothetical protein